MKNPRKNPKPGYLSAYARHARITPAAAAKQLSKVGINYLKPFDTAEADKLIKAAYDPKNASKIRRVFPVDNEPPSPTPKELGYTPSEHVKGSYLDSQRRKELANAELKELEVRRRSGELIEATEVERTLYEKARQTRDALLSLADRLAGILAPITDQAKVHHLLSKEIHQALEALTTDHVPDTQEVA